MQTPTLTRRTALRLGGGTVVLGSLGLLATSPAGAQAQNSLQINDITVSTDEGDLSFVDVAVEGHVAWDGFDIPVDAFAWEVIVEVETAGGQTGSHVLFDQRAAQAPVLLENVSSDGDGSDGWGGPGEYVDQLVVPEETRAVEGGYAGHLHHDSYWRYLADDGVATPKSIETPAVIGTDVPEMDNPDDGTTRTHAVTLVSNLYLYTIEPNGRNNSVTTLDGTQEVYLLGKDDGTLSRAHGESTFSVAVENEPSSTSGDGTGTVTGG